MKTLRSIPGWVWFVVFGLLVAVIEDLRHQACEVRGGVVIQGNVIDVCREPRK